MAKRIIEDVWRFDSLQVDSRSVILFVLLFGYEAILFSLLGWVHEFVHEV